MNNNAESSNYGQGEASFNAAGGFEGIKQLVDAFYDAMETRPQAQRIRDMHSPNLDESRDKLTRFLAGWLGGPREYASRYGPMSIPQVHKHLRVDETERDMWLLCMKQAIDQQPYSLSFKTYLLQQLSHPAERVRQVSEGR